MSESITTETSSTVALRGLFAFPFEGEQWRNSFLIGSLLILLSSWIPLIPALFAYGYVLQIMRQGIDGRPLHLPAWENWGELGLDGLKVLLIGFLYMLPGGLVLLCGFLVYLTGLVGGIVGVESGANPEIFPLALFSGMATWIGAIFLGSMLLLLGTLPLPVAVAHLVRNNSLGAAFRPGELWAIFKANRLGYFIAWVIAFGLVGVTSAVSMLAYGTFILACFLPFLMAPLGFYLLLVSAAVFGQTYRDALALTDS